MPWGNTGSVGNGKLTKTNSSNPKKTRAKNIRSEKHYSYFNKSVSVKVEN